MGGALCIVGESVNDTINSKLIRRVLAMESDTETRLMTAITNRLSIALFAEPVLFSGAHPNLLMRIKSHQFLENGQQKCSIQTTMFGVFLLSDNVDNVRIWFEGVKEGKVFIWRQIASSFGQRWGGKEEAVQLEGWEILRAKKKVYRQKKR